MAVSVNAQKHEFANWKRYAQANTELGAPAKGEKRVVLMGNSITDGWPGKRPEFFKENKIIGRGIGGQTSSFFASARMLLTCNPRLLLLTTEPTISQRTQVLTTRT